MGACGSRLHHFNDFLSTLELLQMVSDGTSAVPVHTSAGTRAHTAHNEACVCQHSGVMCRYKRFAAVYLLAGLSGSVASYVLSDLTTVGASGALFGLLGALVAYFAKNPKLERAGQQIFYILGILGFNVLLGMDEGGMVDNTGHFAGFAAGLWLGAFLAPRWQVRQCHCRAARL